MTTLASVSEVNSHRFSRVRNRPRILDSPISVVPVMPASEPAQVVPGGARISSRNRVGKHHLSHTRKPGKVWRYHKMVGERLWCASSMIFIPRCPWVLGKTGLWCGELAFGLRLHDQPAEPAVRPSEALVLLEWQLCSKPVERTTPNPQPRCLLIARYQRSLTTCLSAGRGVRSPRF